MIRPFARYWGFVAALHLIWAVVLPGSRTRAAALVGAALAAIAFVASRRSAPAGGATMRSPAALLPFLLPILALVATPRLAFLWLDGRAWIVTAWLVVAAAGALSTDERAAGARLWVGLFLFWTSAFWLCALWDLGLRDVVLLVDRSAGNGCSFDPLTVMTRVWETQPVSEHAFLGWRVNGAFEAGEPYARHTQPFLLSMYAWVTAARVLTGLSLPAASNSTMLLNAVVILAVATVLIARLGLLRRGHQATGLVVLFLGYGFLATTWRLWTDLFRFASDNMFPLQAAMMVLVAAAFVPPVKPRLALAACLAFVAPAPLYVLFLLVPLALVFGEPATTWRDVYARNRILVRISVPTVIVAAVVMALPIALSAWKGYAAYSQPLIVRSGLDGATTYFDTLFLALWRGHAGTCFPRGPADLLLPAVLPLLAAAPLAFRRDHGLPVHPARLLLFVCSLYLLSWILFPQALSIHPYLYDHFLIVPMAIVGIVLLLAEPIYRRLNGPWLLVLAMLLTGAIMSNLIAIAQAVVALRH